MRLKKLAVLFGVVALAILTGLAGLNVFASCPATAESGGWCSGPSGGVQNCEGSVPCLNAGTYLQWGAFSSGPKDKMQLNPNAGAQHDCTCQLMCTYDDNDFVAPNWGCTWNEDGPGNFNCKQSAQNASTNCPS